ncbi:hypothetical protein [Sphingosinithalassobacter sp. LHW66-3]|uniref:hypothetical protein n=1 Tax=Sphingosinithalassobacter sp. LHW66-3 TaxID=3424718 RepID=UPI003D6BD8D9
MKKLLMPLALLAAGLGVGGGAAFATSLLLGPPAPAGEAPEEAAAAAYVPGGSLLAPLVFPDGRLAGYVKVDLALEVPEDKAEFVTARLPLLMHEVNMRTFKKPLASGPDGALPDIAGFRSVVEEAATPAFGAGVVRRVAITQAVPA